MIIVVNGQHYDSEDVPITMYLEKSDKKNSKTMTGGLMTVFPSKSKRKEQKQILQDNERYMRMLLTELEVKSRRTQRPGRGPINKN